MLFLELIILYFPSKKQYSNNKPKHKDVTYTRIVESATDDALQAVGQALAGLQGKDLLHVIRIDEVSLS